MSAGLLARQASDDHLPHTKCVEHHPTPTRPKTRSLTRSPQDLLPGSLDMLVLRSLADGERHGFDVSRWVRERTRDVLHTPDAALYKALHRLEGRGLLASRWGRSENRRKAKYYRLTTQGATALQEERAAWEAFVSAVNRAMEHPS